jgi:hypothetical protein
MTLQTAALGEFHDLRMAATHHLTPLTTQTTAGRHLPVSYLAPGYLIGWRTRVGPGLPAGLWPWLLIVYRAWAAASRVIAAISSSLMRRPTPAVTAATPVVLTLISLSALAHDIQHVRAGQEPGTVAAERARQQPALTVISRAAPSGRRRGLIRTYVMFLASVGGLTCGNVRFRGR